jgi:hypothetical protein
MPHAADETSHKSMLVLEEWRRKLAPDRRASKLRVLHLVDLHEPFSALALRAHLFQIRLRKPLHPLKLEMSSEPVPEHFPQGLLRSTRALDEKL